MLACFAPSQLLLLTRVENKEAKIRTAQTKLIEPAHEVLALTILESRKLFALARHALLIMREFKPCFLETKTQPRENVSP